MPSEPAGSDEGLRHVSAITNNSRERSFVSCIIRSSAYIYGLVSSGVPDVRQATGFDSQINESPLREIFEPKIPSSTN